MLNSKEPFSPPFEENEFFVRLEAKIREAIQREEQKKQKRFWLKSASIAASVFGMVLIGYLGYVTFPPQKNFQEKESISTLDEYLVVQFLQSKKQIFELTEEEKRSNSEFCKELQVEKKAVLENLIEQTDEI